MEADGSTSPDADDHAGETLALAGGGSVRILGRMPRSVRLWVATLTLPAPLLEHLHRFGRPIRYRYVPDSWPLYAYTNAFAVEPGSAEMPSAGRVVTAEVVTDLVAHGIVVAPIVLHTGVASLEAHEAPYPERYRVPASTARLVNATHAAGGRVVAVGTTVVRALETVAAEDGFVHPGSGWTELVISPERGVRVVDGLLTGWHEPEASHLRMLEAIAGRPALELAYGAALEGRYRWHEFGDVHLILRSPARRPLLTASLTLDRSHRPGPSAVERAAAGVGRPAQRALRRAPARSGDGGRRRRDARHDGERRPPAPHRARRRRPAGGR